MNRASLIRLTNISSEELRVLEQVSFNALPALHTLLVDGWIIRLAKGYTRRANSVNSIFKPTKQDIYSQIEACEAIYASQGQDTIFKMTTGVQPSHLDSILDECGYAPARDYTLVQTCDLGQFKANGAVPEVSVHLSEIPSATWFDAYCTLNNLPEQHHPTMWAILQQIIPTAGYIYLERAGNIVAVGLGVCEGDWVGLFDIVVSENQRQQGLGTILMEQLLHWGHKHDAQKAYLQVVGTNEPAQKLYLKLGFSTVYAYWYRRKKLGP